MNPKNRKALLKVLEEYHLPIQDVVLISEPKVNKVWVFQDTKNQKWLLLKFIKEGKSLFPIMLHYYLSESGFSVPKVYTTINNQQYVHTQKGYYYLTEFVQNLEKIDEKQRVEALAKFHVHARFPALWNFNEKGEFPDSNTFLKSYKSKLDELTKWRSSVRSSTLKETINEVIQIGSGAFQQLQTYDVEGYLEQTSKQFTICHGDFNMNNAFVTDNGNFLVLDFDRAYYGPPLEDFRFLMMSQTRNAKKDQLSKLKPLFEHYFAICTEDLQYKDIFKADSMFPHEFYKQMSELMGQVKLKNIGKYEETFVQIADFEKKKYDYLLNGSEWN
ncbi:phosphotransferase [Lederbergia graminis]|uniref:Phosphotransferase n=1 Tax=Lederbergia graminis TaxID=735518 RepID=A0ABW0LMZ8_9BACI